MSLTSRVHLTSLCLIVTLSNQSSVRLLLVLQSQSLQGTGFFIRIVTTCPRSTCPWKDTLTFPDDPKLPSTSPAAPLAAMTWFPLNSRRSESFLNMSLTIASPSFVTRSTKPFLNFSCNTCRSEALPRAPAFKLDRANFVIVHTTDCAIHC